MPPARAWRQGPPEQPVFFFDLGSPAGWIVAERILTELPELAEWVPVHYGADPDPDWDAVAAAAPMPLRRPAAWPPDTGAIMRAATFAKGGGKGVGFAQAAFRQAFAAGRDLADEQTLFLAGAASEIHPAAVERAITLRGTAATLDAATAAARAAGVEQVPAIVTGDTVWSGPDCLEAAAAALAP